MRRYVRAAGFTAAFIFSFAGTVLAQMQEYDEVVTAEAVTQEGMFDVHTIGDQLLFEIPDAVLGRDMIIMSRYAKAQDGLSNAGSSMAPNICSCRDSL